MPIPFRRAANFAGVVASILLAAAVAWAMLQERTERSRIEAARQAIRTLERVLTVHGASGTVETSDRGWPLVVNPAWFGTDLPRNPLVTPDHPWLEVATLPQAHLTDPPLRMTIDESVAGFWYNPWQGVVRARVPVGSSDRSALNLYNRANGTSLDNIHGVMPLDAPDSAETGD